MCFVITLTEKVNVNTHQLFQGLQGLQEDQRYQGVLGLPSALAEIQTKQMLGICL